MIVSTHDSLDQPVIKIYCNDTLCEVTQLELWRRTDY